MSPNVSQCLPMPQNVYNPSKFAPSPPSPQSLTPIHRPSAKQRNEQAQRGERGQGEAPVTIDPPLPSSSLSPLPSPLSPLHSSLLFSNSPQIVSVYLSLSQIILVSSSTYPAPAQAAEGQRGDEDEQLQYLLMQVENRNFTRRIHDCTITI